MPGSGPPGGSVVVDPDRARVDCSGSPRRPLRGLTKNLTNSRDVLPNIRVAFIDHPCRDGPVQDNEQDQTGLPAEFLGREVRQLIS